jgi:hypothetical protein
MSICVYMVVPGVYFTTKTLKKGRMQAGFRFELRLCAGGHPLQGPSHDTSHRKNVVGAASGGRGVWRPSCGTVALP